MDTKQGLLLRPDALELLDRKVTRDGGALRYLEGDRYDIRSSIYRSIVVAGSGPVPHTHPYDEIFVIEAGQARFDVAGQSIDAVAGDIVIVPAGEVHGFQNTGTGVLRHTAFHDGAGQAVSLPQGDERP
jgi:mannose-6-phosphate isomerase-like protein (cupin superfamily)